MGFQPTVHSRIQINGNDYIIGEHPNAAGVPYGQEGRQGTVYLLLSEDKRTKKAMKVFRSKFVNPSLTFHTQQISKFAGMAGLWACDRFIVTPQTNTGLLSKEPDLLYAVIMSWVDGPTWMDILLGKQRLSKKQSFSAAFAFAHVLMDMEQRGLAHCDLSAPNLILPMLHQKLGDVKPVDYVQLIDLEQMFASQLERPEHIPAGSPGYASRNLTQSLAWSAHSDRFSGAVLMAEMLGACTDSFMASAWGESFFAPEEMQNRCERFDQLLYLLRTNWGNALASLFVRAWESDQLAECPTFAEWLMELSKIESSVMTEIAASSEAAVSGIQTPALAPTLPQHQETPMNGALLQKARKLEEKGKYKEAIEVYRSIHVLNPHSSLAKEIDIAIAELQQNMQNKNKRKKGTVSKRMKRITLTATIILTIGIIGFLAYLAVGAVDKSSSLTKLKSANAKIEELNQAVAKRDQQIAQLNAKQKEQDKPIAQRRKELTERLNQDFNEIQNIANSDPDKVSDLDLKTFQASQDYVNHLYEFIQISYNLDQPFIDQTNIVQGYYYPYMYNRDRNAQLNLQFFTNYKQKFMQ